MIPENKWFNRFLPLLLIILIIILTLFVYFPSLSAGFFCWDDKTVPLAPMVRILNLQQVWLFFSTFHAGLYHPLTTLSFAVDYKLGHGEALPFHLTNLLIHIANTVLLFYLLRSLFNDTLLAIWVSVLFGIHPAHIESVAWITSRKDLLYAFFFILSLYCYMAYTRKENKAGLYILALLFFLFSCLSKIQAAVFPLVLLPVDYLLNRPLFSKKNMLEKIPFVIIAILFGIINIYAQKDYGYVGYKANYSFIEQCITFSFGFCKYLYIIIFPFSLSVFYPFPFLPGGHITLFCYFCPLILFAFVLLIIWFILRLKKEYVFGASFFLICIVIVLLIQTHRDAIIADRYTYLASLGIFIILVKGLTDLASKHVILKWAITSIGLVYLLLCCKITLDQNEVWTSSYNLLQAAAKQYPKSPIILNSLASEAITLGLYDKSLEYLNTAISVNPDYTDAFYNKGITEDRMGKFPEAISDLSVSLRNNPYYTDAYFARGNVFRQMGEAEKAMQDYTKVIVLEKNNAGAWNNRAIVKGQLGDFSGAIEDLDMAISFKPDMAPAYYLRGVAKFKTGINGCSDLQKALQLNYQKAEKAIQFYCR